MSGGMGSAWASGEEVGIDWEKVKGAGWCGWIRGEATVAVGESISEWLINNWLCYSGGLDRCQFWQYYKTSLDKDERQSEVEFLVKIGILKEAKVLRKRR